MLAPSLEHERSLWRICQAMRQSVSQVPVAVGQRRLDVTVSVGGVLADPAGSHELIIDQADRALYAAKRQGRDRTRLFSELTANDLAAEEPEAIRLAQALSLSAGVREGVPEEHAEEVAELAGAIASGLGLPEDIGPALPPRRLAARHRQGGDPGSHPGQARRARRARMAHHAHARRDRRAARAPHRRGEHRPRWPCGTITSASTAAAIRTASRATRSRSRRASWPSPTPSAPSLRTARTAARARRSTALAELRAGAGRDHDARAVEALARVIAARPAPALAAA